MRVAEMTYFVQAAVATSNSFATLIQRIRAGDQDAVCELVAEYEPHVRRFIRRRLNQRLRSKFDSADFAQVVWGSLFREPHRFHKLSSPTDFIRLLAGMVSNKVMHETRRRLDTEKFDLQRESPLEDGDVLPSREPTPSAVAIVKERWSKMLAGQSDQVRSIVNLRIQGHTFLDIAHQLDIEEWTARRAIDRLAPAS